MIPIEPLINVIINGFNFTEYKLSDLLYECYEK